MRTFRCDNCGHPLFFENVQCLQCGSPLAFLPERLALCAVEPLPGNDAALWRRRTRHGAADDTRRYRLCHNQTAYRACNFPVPAGNSDGAAPLGWEERHVSVYATAHPWEDWAETWAHYLHRVDLLETAFLVPYAPSRAGQRRWRRRGLQLSAAALDKLRFVHDLICSPGA